MSLAKRVSRSVSGHPRLLAHAPVLATKASDFRRRTGNGQDHERNRCADDVASDTQHDIQQQQSEKHYAYHLEDLKHPLTSTPTRTTRSSFVATTSSAAPRSAFGAQPALALGLVE